MKRFVPIALLALLLYNTFGLAVAVLCFDKEFKTASPRDSSGNLTFLAVSMPSLPYTSTWENEDGVAGLIKKDGEFYNVVHQKLAHDTLYITLQANTSARDRFFELAENMESLTDRRQDRETPSGRAVKLLNELVKSYLPIQNKFESILAHTSDAVCVPFSHYTFTLSPISLSLDSPPPEFS